jgi:starch-binding outer membrane protein, SusD/RagB family
MDIWSNIKHRCRGEAHGLRTFRGAARSLRHLALPLLVGFGGCDFEVTNPGPVQDRYLDEPGAHAAIANGAARAMGTALHWTGLHAAPITRELFPTGQTGQFGIEPMNAVGFLRSQDQGSPWGESHRARWLAEQGLERLRASMGADFDRSRIAAQAALWAGYANRLLGENMCHAVIDGGAPQPATEHLRRAETYFAEALRIGTTAQDARVTRAATAGRASVRLSLGNWNGAVADARTVPTDFAYQMPYYEIGDDFQANRIAVASLGQPYRAHTVWGTVYEQYYLETGDPRTPWRRTNLVGIGALDCCGPVPWWPQEKFTKFGAIDLSTGSEMRLIEAEAHLRDGRWQEAMTLINAVRTAARAPTVTASNLEEAWTRLKRERGIDLWLEARRLNDFRRWKAENTPGSLHPREVQGTASHLQAQDLCFPIPIGEQETNPNIPTG